MCHPSLQLIEKPPQRYSTMYPASIVSQHSCAVAALLLVVDDDVVYFVFLWVFARKGGRARLPILRDHRSDRHHRLTFLFHGDLRGTGIDAFGGNAIAH